MSVAGVLFNPNLKAAYETFNLLRRIVFGGCECSENVCLFTRKFVE